MSGTDSAAPSTILHNLTRHWGFLLAAGVCWIIDHHTFLGGVFTLGWLAWWLGWTIHDWNVSRITKSRAREVGRILGGLLIVATIIGLVLQLLGLV